MKVNQVLPGLEVTLINWAAAGRRQSTKVPIVSDPFPYRNIYEPAVPTVKIWASQGTKGGLRRLAFFSPGHTGLRQGHQHGRLGQPSSADQTVEPALS